MSQLSVSIDGILISGGSTPDGPPLSKLAKNEAELRGFLAAGAPETFGGLPRVLGDDDFVR